MPSPLNPSPPRTSRIDNIVSSLPLGSMHEDLSFFLSCLVPLARIVASSAPASFAWYTLVNEKTLRGTGLPEHPWSGRPDEDGETPSYSVFSSLNFPVMRGISRMLERGAGVVAYGRHIYKGRSGSSQSDTGDKDDDGDVDSVDANLLSMRSVQDKDQWSAMLVSAGLVRSLVDCLRACQDSSILAQDTDSVPAAAAAAAGSSSDAVNGERPLEWAHQLAGQATRGEESCEQSADEAVAGNSKACFGCELETARVEAMLALGGMLTAHPLAARDRLELAGGMACLRRVADVSHACSCWKEKDKPASSGGGTGPIASTVGSARPLLREHGSLVALQVIRLCVRMGVSKAVPATVVEEAAQLVEALSPAMRSLWERHRVEDSGKLAAWCSDKEREVSLGGGEESSKGEEDIAAVMEDYARRLSRDLLPLRCPKKLVMRLVDSDVVSSCASRRESVVAGAGLSGAGSATEAQRMLDSPSYLLCG